MNTAAFSAIALGIVLVLSGSAIAGLCNIAIGLCVIVHILRTDINLDRALLAKWEKLTKGD